MRYDNTPPDANLVFQGHGDIIIIIILKYNEKLFYNINTTVACKWLVF